ncbi:MAG: metal-dependent hydrolase, partial [Bacteroidota bacterium]
ELADIEADYILISHGHGDHIADAVELAQQTGATCVSNFEIYQWLTKQGVDKVHPMNHGGQWTFDFARVKMVSAIHSSSFPDGSYAGHPAGFILFSETGNFYFAGDTALMSDMKTWGERFNLDFAVLPIGDNFTMGAEDAALAANWLQVDRVVGVHYDTFGYIEIDKTVTRQAFEERQVELLLPRVGEVINI